MYALNLVKVPESVEVFGNEDGYVAAHATVLKMTFGVLPAGIQEVVDEAETVTPAAICVTLAAVELRLIVTAAAWAGVPVVATAAVAATRAIPARRRRRRNALWDLLMRCPPAASRAASVGSVGPGHES